MKTLVAFASVLFVTSGCTKDTTAPAVAFDAQTMLADLSTKVMLATYAELEGHTSALVYRIDLFAENTPTEANLRSAQAAWFVARRPWNQIQAFLFGPVVTRGVTAAIDSWPIDRAGIEAVLAGNATLSHEYIYGLDGTLKGFHAIEYLLFGLNGTKTLPEFTQREREYLIWAASNVGQATNALHSEWWPGSGAYRDTLAQAGATGNRTYTTREAGLRQIVSAMIAGCDRLDANISRALEEAPFGQTSILDFYDNLQGVQSIYRGNRGVAQLVAGRYVLVPGSGVRDLVLANIPLVDRTLQAQIAHAIASVERMAPTPGETISDSARVATARASVRDLKQTLEAHVLPLTQ